MKNILHKLHLILQDDVLRKRVLFTLGALLAFRLLANIPLPFVDTNQLAALLGANDFLAILNVFSGGGLTSLSIVMLGVSPFITASIIMQLLTFMFPKVKAMYQEEGESGRKKMTQYSRLMTVPLAIIQGFGFIGLLKSQGVLLPLTSLDVAILLVIAVAGSMLLTWIGELVSEFGVGNGVSLIIFAGIVAAIPTQASRLFFSFTPEVIPTYVAGLVVALIVIYAVVVITEAERPIPVTYAKQVRGNNTYGGQSTYLPIRLNQAGVIPIIFAISILLFPNMIIQFLGRYNLTGIWETLLNVLNTIITNQWIYGILYFVLVFAFTYFYTAVTFDPEKIAENLQKGGAFIPGVRPGKSTVDHLAHIATRLTLFSALFLSVIAVLPFVIQAVTKNQSIAIGGTALLIVVSVVIELIKKLDAQVSMREY